MEKMRAIRILLGILALLGFAPPASADWVGRNARVAVPVADLRREPRRPPAERGHDPLEESQLLYGDLVAVQEEKDGWVRVSASDQMEFTHARRWEGYPGWVERAALVPESEEWEPNAAVRVKWAQVRVKPDAQAPVRLKLSAGTQLLLEAEPPSPRPESKNGWRAASLLDGSIGWIRTEELLTEDDLTALQDQPGEWRARIVSTARLFLGDPYYWGGRSAYDSDAAPPPHTGVDCSGLVGLAYQVNGSFIPRDAHEQWMNSRKISREQLQPADLVFLWDSSSPDRVGHVLLYAGSNRVIEGPGTGEAVREIDLDERLKQDPGRRTAYGSYLPSE